MATSFKYHDFTPVLPRRKRKPAQRPQLLTLVKQAAEELNKQDWNASCQRLLQDRLDALSVPPTKIVCLGLGSPCASANSRAQLAFLLELCKTTAIEHAQVALYDPVFSQEDAALFEQLGLTLLADKLDGGHSLDCPTILWMPHCDIELYEAVLAANWSHEQLADMTLIANRLADYVDNHSKTKLETRAPHLLSIAAVMECKLLPPCSALSAAFNNIAIQWVTAEQDFVLKHRNEFRPSDQEHRNRSREHVDANNQTSLEFQDTEREREISK